MLIRIITNLSNNKSFKTYYNNSNLGCCTPPPDFCLISGHPSLCSYLVSQTRKTRICRNLEKTQDFFFSVAYSWILGLAQMRTQWVLNEQAPRYCCQVTSPMLGGLQSIREMKPKSWPPLKSIQLPGLFFFFFFLKSWMQ